MADDTRNFIEQTQSRARLITGNELSPDELATEFSKFDQSARVDCLQQIEADSLGEEYTTVEKAAKMYTIKSRLMSRHQLLNKVGR